MGMQFWGRVVSRAGQAGMQPHDRPAHARRPSTMAQPAIPSATTPSSHQAPPRVLRPARRTPPAPGNSRLLLHEPVVYPGEGAEVWQDLRPDPAGDGRRLCSLRGAAPRVARGRRAAYNAGNADANVPVDRGCSRPLTGQATPK